MEMFGVTADETGEESSKLLEEFLSLQKEMFSSLELHYRSAHTHTQHNTTQHNTTRCHVKCTSCDLTILFDHSLFIQQSAGHAHAGTRPPGTQEVRHRSLDAWEEQLWRGELCDGMVCRHHHGYQLPAFMARCTIKFRTHGEKYVSVV